MALARALALLVLVAAAVTAASMAAIDSLHVGTEVYGEGVRVSYAANGLSKLHIRVASGGELAAFTLLLAVPGPDGAMGIEVSGHGFTVVDAGDLYKRLLWIVESHNLAQGSRIPLVVFYSVPVQPGDGTVIVYAGVAVVPLDAARLLRGDSIYLYIDAARLADRIVELQGMVLRELPGCVQAREAVACVRWRLADTWSLDVLAPMLVTGIQERLRSVVKTIVHDVYVSSSWLGFPSIVVYGGDEAVVKYREGFTIQYPWERLLANLHCRISSAGVWCEVDGNRTFAEAGGRDWVFAATGLKATVWVIGAELIETTRIGGAVASVRLLDRVYVVETAPRMTSLGMLETGLVTGARVTSYLESVKHLEEEHVRDRGASVRVTLADCARKARVEPEGLLLPIGSIIASATGVDVLARANPAMLLDEETLYGAVYVDLGFGRQIVAVEASCYYVETSSHRGYIAMVVVAR